MSNIRWIGGAPAVRDLFTLTVAGTWASGDIARVTIGDKNLLVTLGASASVVVADIAAEIANAFNASSNASPGTGFTWNYGGQEFLEFREAAAVADGATVVITALVAYAGVPIGVAAGETTAGDGTLVAVNTTPATGPNHWDNAFNWDGGALPVNDDVVFFDTGSVSCLYGLTRARDDTINHDLYISNDWSGALGLPSINAVGLYAEYRQRYFQFHGGAKNLQILPGLLGQTNVGRVWIDLTDQTAALVTIAANRGTSTTTPTIYLAGADATGNNSTLTVQSGAVSIEPDDAPTATNRYCGFIEINVGKPNGASTDTKVTIGRNARLSVAAGGFTIHSGEVHSYALTPTATIVTGGSLFLYSETSSHGSFEVYAGAALYPVGEATIVKVELYAGTLDLRRGTEGMVITDIKAYAGSSIYDPGGRFFGATSTDFDAVGCAVSQLTLSLPPDRKWTSAAAVP